MDFDNLKSEWDNQPLKRAPERGSEIIREKVNAIKSKQKFTNIILVITALVLGGFFIYISAYREPIVMLALIMMIMAIVTRIIIELLSRQNLRKLSVANNMESFKSDLTLYYIRRKKVHYIITPLLITIYIVGFVLLLPYFKASLSGGFYTYIKVSSIVVLFVLCVFIYQQIKKELSMLNQLQQID